MMIDDKDTNSRIQRVVAQNLEHNDHSMRLRLGVRLLVHMA